MATVEAPISQKINETPFDSSKFKSAGCQIRLVEFFDELWTDSSEDIPSYYIIERNDVKTKVQIGISFEITRNWKIKENSAGKLFYPIIVKEGFTGDGFSINAPFILNTLRTELAPQNERNAELLTHAATFAGRLLREVLLRKFGARAYLLLKQTSSHQEIFLEALYDSINKHQSLLNNEYSEEKEIEDQKMFCAKDKYLPCKIFEQDGDGVERYHPAEDLYGFIGDERCITSKIDDPEVMELLVAKLGAKPFTIHDVISLKVNDYAPENKAVKGWHYTNKHTYTSDMAQENIQVKYTDAINNYFTELTDDEKNELTTSYSWLTEAGNLRPLKGKGHLFLWKGTLGDFPGLDKDDLVHHCIANHPLMKKLRAREYNVNRVIINVIIPKLQEGEFDEEKKSRLLDFIIANASKLTSATVGALKNHAIFLDNTEHFVEFNRLIRPSKAVLQAFSSSISVPHRKLLESKVFLNRFRIRQAINDKDIIRRAEQLFQDQQPISKEDVLLFMSYLNKRKIGLELASRLKEIVKLPCVGNTFANLQMQRVYFDTKKMQSVLGKRVNYAEGNFKNLFLRLGVRFQPLSLDIIDFISEICNSGSSPTDRSLPYIELSKALTREGIDQKIYRDSKIINIKGMCHRPKDVFLNSVFAGEFLDSKAYLNARGKFHEALIKLGCKTFPTDEDYVDFLQWVASQLPKLSDKVLKEKYVPLIHYAYSKMRTLDFISHEDNVILTHDGNMVSQKEVMEHRVFLDDDPQLSERIKAEKLPVWFVDCGPRGYELFEILNVPKLSASVTLSKKLIKGPYPANDFAENLLPILKSSDVVNAIQSIIQQNSELRRDLKDDLWLDSMKELKAVRFAESIINICKIDTYEFSVETGCCIDNGIIYFSKGLEQSEMRDALAIEVAKTVLRTKCHQASLADAVDRFLDGNIFHYLNTRGYILQKSLEKPKPIKKVVTTQPKQSEKTFSSKSGTSKSASEKSELAVQETGLKVEEQRVRIETDQDKKKSSLTDTGTGEQQLSQKESNALRSDWEEEEEPEEETEIRVETISCEEVETPPSTGWRGKGSKPAQRFRTADIAYDWVIRMEQCDDSECLPVNVSDDDTGYDIKVSKGENIAKMIEVKATSGQDFPRKIIMTPNEWRTAKRHGPLYWLYVVRDVTQENKKIGPEYIRNRVRKYQDPYKLFKGVASFEKRVVTRSEKNVVIIL